MKHAYLLLALLALLVSAPVFAGPGAGKADTPQATALTAKQRVEIARDIAARWAPYVQRQGGRVQEWAVKLGRYIGTADARNVQEAAAMPTYETMMAVLQGQPVSSKSVRSAIAAAAAAPIVITPQSIGSVSKDSSYTPLPNGRCRIADSRVIASPIGAAQTRELDVEDVVSYASQGGSGSSAGDGSANCGIPNFANAFAVSITVLTQGNEGFFKIFEDGQPFTTGSTVFFTPANSASNDIIVKSCQSCHLELAIYASSSVHYVVDVVGYFIRPEATALECVETATSSTTVAASGQGTAIAPACPTGFTATATNCQSTSWSMPFVSNSGGTCLAQNNGGSSADLSASRTCCRTPGR